MDKDTYIKQLESEIIELEKRIEEPLRHQVVDIPPIEPQVTEYVHIYRCKDCGRLIYRSLPDGLKRKHFGPGTLSVVGILTGGFAGKLVSGYYNAYNFYKLIRRICRAHLKRGFKAISKARGTPGKTGQELYGLAKKVLKLRKSSFGTQSERCARYVERILTVCATCRLQGRIAIEYLREACRCHSEGIPVPSLIKTLNN